MKLRAKIVGGIIKAIGTTPKLPFELPQEINFDNYKSYACVNIKKTADIGSWVDITPKEIIEEPKIIIPVKELTWYEKLWKFIISLFKSKK